jgi:hypothetical protein
MDGAWVAIWGIALVAIVVLLALVMSSIRRSTSGAGPAAGGTQSPVELFRDTLLFYHEEQNMRSASRGAVIIRLPGEAWRPEWHPDLLRVQVITLAPDSVSLPVGWKTVQVLGAFSIRAYRVTELGTEVEISQFAAPMDIVLTTQTQSPGLCYAVRVDGNWRLGAVPASTDRLESMDLPLRSGRVIISADRPGDFCLLRATEEPRLLSV